MWLLCSEAENADRGPKARRAGPAQVPRHRPRRQSQQTRRDEEAPPPPACPGLHVTCRTRRQSLHPRASSATYSPRLQAPRPVLEHGRAGRRTHFSRPLEQTTTNLTLKQAGFIVVTPQGRPCPGRGSAGSASAAPAPAGGPRLAAGCTRCRQGPPGRPRRSPPEGPPLGGAAQRSRAVTPAFGGREHLAACTWDEGGFAQVSELFSPWN